MQKSIHQVRINQRVHENLCMRQTAMTSNALSHIQKDLLSQPLQLLSGVDILGNASSAFGNMSQGVAALSMDEKFLQSRRRQGTHSSFQIYIHLLGHLHQRLYLIVRFAKMQPLC